MFSFGEILVIIVSFFGLYMSIFFFMTLFENMHKLGNPSLKRYFSVGIVVPAYNEETTIGKTIESLLKLDYPKDKLKIVVIDDGSTDKTYAVAKKYAKEKNVFVYTKKNGGKGSALNFALKILDTDLVGALDADSFVDKHALKRMIGYFENENVMAVTPSMKIYAPNNFLRNIQRIEYLFGILLRKTFAFMGAIHVTPGPFTIFRKFFFDKYGGYEEHNLTEDIEIALRIQSHNYIIENSLDAFVYTVGPKKFMPLYKQRVRWYRGFMDNVFRYKHLFGIKHGNLGAFMLPSAFISVFLIMLSTIYFLVVLVDNMITWFFNLKAINFDIFSLRFNLDLFYFDIGPLAMLAIIGLVFGITTILLAKYLAKEKANLKYSYIIYLCIYSFLFAYWWLMSVVYKCTNKKVIWGKTSL